MSDYVINTGDREAFIAGLRELADFLADTPAVLVPPRASLTLIVKSDNPEARRTGAEAAATSLGVPLEDLGEGCLSAYRKFGPLTYYVIALPPEEYR
ncbi:hypothetical protein [Streptomyces sp. MP131-18]|uniref:hypothetical protein n=1 Tax=Streptomyces sp. MP131-18 TaxID=1857892 RepID=UPI00097C8B84|nr:hypothetical protein [Streptomyces sp. MP131-18]ONK11196.1 hypothetical protein STBA_19260 [Streptomyces sp. MP131-18]